MASQPLTGIFIGAGPGGANPQQLELKRANRHGLIAGATGTGKTVTLQGIVEGLSAAGVPTFVADVKGDLAGLAMPGAATAKPHEAFAARAKDIGYEGWSYQGFPVQFWDLFGEQGHPVRTTVSEMGPLLLARLMNLNDVQEGVLTIAFTVADKEGLMLLDLDDLQAMLVHCGEQADALTLEYGNVSKMSVGAIQRSLLQLRAQGGEHFFGEPALDLEDFLKLDENGKGIINILAADKLMSSPRLYSTFLLWLLSELFELLPEIGDPDKPKLAFFFDEAHLLFDGASQALLDQIERTARLIRSKGVGVYFVTQAPTDVPSSVLAQLGNRVQHALRAFTPDDADALPRCAFRGDLDGRSDQPFALLGGQGGGLAGRSAGDEAVDAGQDLPPDEPPEGGLVEGAVGRERRDQGGERAAQQGAGQRLADLQHLHVPHPGPRQRPVQQRPQGLVLEQVLGTVKVVGRGGIALRQRSQERVQ